MGRCVAGGSVRFKDFPEKAMSKVSWMHISDLHIFPESDTEAAALLNREETLEALCETLRKQDWEKPNIQKPQFILITGDLAWRGTKEDTGKTGGTRKWTVQSFLDEMLDALDYKPDENRQRIFAVAGNHDTDRKGLLLGLEKGHLGYTQNASILVEMLDGEEGGDYRNIGDRVLKRLKNYARFYNEYRGDGIAGVEVTGDAPVDMEALWYTKEINTNFTEGAKVSVVGLCSSWLCQAEWKGLLEPAELGKWNERTDFLTMGDKKVRGLLKKIKQDEGLVFGLMHHDYRKTSDSQKPFCETLEDKCDFILYGHEHADTWAEPINGKAHRICAGSTYNSGRSRQYFTVAEVDPSDSDNLVRMQTFQYRSDKAKWSIDHDADPTGGVRKFGYEFANGILTFPLHQEDDGGSKKPPSGGVGGAVLPSGALRGAKRIIQDARGRLDRRVAPPADSAEFDDLREGKRKVCLEKLDKACEQAGGAFDLIGDSGRWNKEVLFLARVVTCLENVCRSACSISMPSEVPSDREKEGTYQQILNLDQMINKCLKLFRVPTRVSDWPENVVDFVGMDLQAYSERQDLTSNLKQFFVSVKHLKMVIASNEFEQGDCQDFFSAYHRASLKCSVYGMTEAFVAFLKKNSKASVDDISEALDCFCPSSESTEADSADDQSGETKSGKSEESLSGKCPQDIENWPGSEKADSSKKHSTGEVKDA